MSKMNQTDKMNIFDKLEIRQSLQTISLKQRYMYIITNIDNADADELNGILNELGISVKE